MRWWFVVVFQFLWLFAGSYVLERGTTELILQWEEDLKNDRYTIYLKENNHINDSDHLLLFTVKEISTEPTWKFVMGQFDFDQKFADDEAEFYTNQNIDYETETTHSYQIMSLISSTTVSVIINTINYDDESPTLTAPMCSMYENADYDKTNTNCTCTLSDPDGWLGNTTFGIVNSNPYATNILEKEDQLFKFEFDKNIGDTVYNTTVYLTTLHQLDYETKIFYSFVVHAKDGAGHSTIPNQDVTAIVDVLDVNDMPPQWTDYFNTMQIVEKTSYVFNVTAVDGDRGINAAINYSLISYDEDICEEWCVKLTTDNGKGIIEVNPIDRDAKDLTTYKFQIMAQEEDVPAFDVTLNVTFFIEDVDDNSPLFMSITSNNNTNIDFTGDDPKVVDFSFLENFAGTLDGSILIQDIDTGENAQFSVELLENDDRTYKEVYYTDAFLIVPTAGYRNGDFTIPVKNYSYLDFENAPWQDFSFYVHSWGQNASKEDYLTVNIHLIDYNDELPIFPQSAYSVSVNETIKKGEEILAVKATDRDAEDAELLHRLAGSDAIIKLMAIDKAEGIITVAEDDAFDYDRVNPVFFQVQAVDAVNHTTTVSVTVNLLDVNNKAPTYKVEDIIRVDENQDVGIKLNATITASDVDTTRNLIAEINWEESFAMKNSLKLNQTIPENLKAMQFLNLTFEKTSEDTITLHLIVNENNAANTAPDYETFDTLYLNVNITDLNTELPEFADKMSIDASIVIYINDINDNAPIFTDETIMKNRTVYEKSKVGTIVGTIEATDADVGDIVKYSCVYTNEMYDWFDCDSSGQITANTGEIDADTDKLYSVSINCTATDGCWSTSQVFDIYILDTNDHTPQVKVNDTLPSTQIVYVLEKKPDNTPVTSIRYEDADRDPPFHTVECRINRDEECYDTFVIDGDELIVSNGKDLDRDSNKPNYTCTPTCYDNPKYEQNDVSNINGSTTFIIYLIDINDHCPEMKATNLNTIENIKKGELIGKIEATDIDEGNNAEIVMNVLTVTKLEGDKEVDYTDQNLFNTSKAEDYYIDEVWKQWHLVANKDLRDYYGEYHVQLNISDLGDPPNGTEDVGNEALKQKAKLNLTIEKFNYYPPKFAFPNASKLTFSLSSDQEPGKQLAMYYNNETFGNIEITDGDEDEPCLDKWTPTFNVILINGSASLKNFFVIKQIDRCTAQLQVDSSYDKNEAVDVTMFQLRVTATLDDVTEKEGEAAYSESIEFKFYFVDVNDDPIFDQDLGSWNVSFLENDQSLTMPLPKEREAFYPNVDNSDDIPKYYSLESDNDDVKETFEIDLITGTIKLLRILDFLETRFYQFVILASRNQSGLSSKQLSRLTVNVDVIEINKYTPQWSQAAFFGTILGSSQKSQLVVTLNATDLDEIDEGKLTYSLNSSIEAHGSSNLDSIKEPFLLDGTTGAITLNFQVEATMNGYFVFWVKVQDVVDEYGNGPHENLTTVLINIITDDNTVTFKFENPLDVVLIKKERVLETISACLGWDCYYQNIDNDTQNGVKFDNVTAANIYCLLKTDSNTTLLTSSDMKTKLNNIDTFQQLKHDLLEFGILLQSFQSDAGTVDSLETSLKAALIGVSVVLGAICLILAVSFFFKARELNRRLKKLTEQKFGSDESTINRKGISAPNTNIFAVEGSNPVFNNEFSKDDLMRGDIGSIHSGDSDLIGVEDNAEFDEIFGKEKY